MTSIKDLSQLYDSSSAVVFDSTVHGDGGLHVHYGLFQPGSESTKEATHATVNLMVRLLQTVGGVTLTPRTRILDLGAGLGGPMHHVVASSGCQAVCLNLCEKQNETNQQQVARLGLVAKITVLQGDKRELPSDWAEAFDVVWSQDAFLHNEEKGQILKEANKARGNLGVFRYYGCRQLLTTECAFLPTAESRDRVGFTGNVHHTTTAGTIRGPGISRLVESHD